MKQNNGPFPTEEIRQKLQAGALQEAISGAEREAIKLYYSETSNDALAKAFAEGLEGDELIDSVMDALRIRYEEEFTNWEEISEHLIGWIEGAS